MRICSNRKALLSIFEHGLGGKAFEVHMQSKENTYSFFTMDSFIATTGSVKISKAFQRREGAWGLLKRFPPSGHAINWLASEHEVWWIKEKLTKESNKLVWWLSVSRFMIQYKAFWRFSMSLNATESRNYWQESAMTCWKDERLFEMLPCWYTWTQSLA